MTVGTEPLSGRYRLEHKIAAGGMGEVWRAVDETLRRPVAVKLLRPEYASDPSFLQRFRGEAQHTARLSHPGIASVYDYGEVAAANGRPTAYLVMELVEGEPLSAILHRERRLPADRMLDILGQAADALQAAHAAGVIHRDVKPGNLLVRPDGVVKVTDFGIARAVDAAPLTATGIMMGTAYYVSPEQASGRPVTPASDVYSLGVVAYECLAGRRPFDDKNPITVVLAHQQEPPPPLPADVPPAAQGLVHQAMAKDPAHRPASAGAFAQAAATTREMLRGGGPSNAVRRPGEQRRPAEQRVAPPTPAVPARPTAAPPLDSPPQVPAQPPGYPPAADYPPAAQAPTARPPGPPPPYPPVNQPAAADEVPPTDDRRLIQRPLSEWPVGAPGQPPAAQPTAARAPHGRPTGSATQAARGAAPPAFAGGAVGTATPDPGTAGGRTPVGGFSLRQVAARTAAGRTLTWPLFAGLLVVIVIAVTLITRSLAGGNDSAGAPRSLVGAAPSVAMIPAARTVSDSGPAGRPDDVGSTKGSAHGGRGD